MDHSRFCLANPATSVTATAPVGHLGGLDGACRRGRRPDAGAASLSTPSPFRVRLALQDFAKLSSSPRNRVASPLRIGPRNAIVSVPTLEPHMDRVFARV